MSTELFINNRRIKIWGNIVEANSHSFVLPTCQSRDTVGDLTVKLICEECNYTCYATVDLDKLRVYTTTEQVVVTGWCVAGCGFVSLSDSDSEEEDEEDEFDPSLSDLQQLWSNFDIVDTSDWPTELTHSLSDDDN
nr:putative movment protein [Solemoviridae sp.]